MNVVAGKKLLLLAGSANMVDLVKRAKELGIYTIVTDYNDKYDSPAKRVADEVWDISWTDIDKLENACRNAKVDGVIAGYSEFTVENQIMLCERLGLPCYCTKEQLKITRNKDFFKKECIANKVPVVHEYESPTLIEKFPVIVKPVDRGGSIGISIANNKKELDKAVKYAMDMSVCKKIVIEDFIFDGIKIDIYYGIVDGKITLLSTSDTINAKGNVSSGGFSKVIQNGWLCPSKYHNQIISQLDKSLSRMIYNMGIKNGFIAFSGFAIEKDDLVSFVIFEAGFRLTGDHLYSYFKSIGFIDIQDIFIYHALLGDKKKIDIGEINKTNLKAAVVNYYADEGILTCVEGFDMISNLEDFNFMVNIGRLGHQCTKDNAILYKIAMFHFCNNSPDKLASDIDYSNKAFIAYNENGQDMVFERMESEMVKNWWK